MTDSTFHVPPGDGRRAGNAPAAPIPGAAAAKMPSWLFRTILGVSAAVVLVLLYLVASVTVPLIWANSIRDQIGTQLGNSIPIGMFYGFVFTFVPVLIAWQAHRNGVNKWVRISLVAVGVLLLIPNLMTLAVVYGRSQTADDARSIWAIHANWFGTWSQIFMVVGVVCAVAVVVAGRMWLRRGRKLREIRAAEKLVRKSSLARERAAKDAARVAEKAARAAARADRNGPGPGNPAEPPPA